MKIDVNSMSKKELVKLKGEVEKALSSIEKRKKADAKKAIEEAAKKHGFSLNEILGKQKSTRSKGVAKYKNPDDPSQTWSGRGRQPLWIKNALGKGKKLSDFAI